MVELVAAEGASGQFERRYAGDTLNTCVYLARLMRGSGAAIAYVTRLGEDRMSSEMLAQWAGEGIDGSLVRRIPGRVPGIYLVETAAGGERSFTYWRGQSPARDMFGESDRELADTLSRFSLLYVSGVTLAILSEEGRARLLGLMRQCRLEGGSVAYDTNHRPRLWENAETARAVNREAMAAASVLLPSCEDLAAIFDEERPATEWLARLAGTGAEDIVIKDGARPAHGRSGTRSVEVAPRPVASPVDTTAAGDSFNAGYLASRLKGNDIEASMVLAHDLAAAVIRHRGAIIPPSAMPGPDAKRGATAWPYRPPPSTSA